MGVTNIHYKIAECEIVGIMEYRNSGIGELWN